MELYSIPTGNFKLDGGAMFGVVPKSIWNKVYPADDNNLIPLAMRCLLVMDGDRKVLIDNGIGTKQDEKFFGHYYLHGNESLEKSLAGLGHKPDDITDMFLTHLHFDHAGGSIKSKPDGTGYELACPNATYWVSREQWNWATQPNPREKASFLKENILPIENGTLQFINHTGELFPGFHVKFFDGHTKGQAIPVIHYKHKKIVFMADVLPTAAHVPLPYIMSYDTQPLISLREKEEFLNEAVDNGYILFLEHDIFNECCTLERTEKGIRVAETARLEEFLKD
jgi:glyoxylase-like metal-dependent hydrolase (beta-lactamase superfamily II)